MVSGLLGGCMALLAVAQAADTPTEERNAAMMVNGLRVKRLTQPLALTTEQQQKLKTLMDEESKKIAQSQENTAIERSERIAQQRVIKTEYRKKMEEALTAEQREKWAKLDADAQAGKRKRSGSTPSKPAGSAESAPAPKETPAK